MKVKIVKRGAIDHSNLFRPHWHNMIVERFGKRQDQNYTQKKTILLKIDKFEENLIFLNLGNRWVYRDVLGLE